MQSDLQRLADVQAKLRLFANAFNLEQNISDPQKVGIIADVIGTELGGEFGNLPEESGKEFLVILTQIPTMSMCPVKLSDLISLALAAKLGPGSEPTEFKVVNTTLDHEPEKTSDASSNDGNTSSD